MQSMLGMCFNWKVLVALAAVGVGVFVVAPGWGLAVLPLLILAACPLSMLGMALVMGRKAMKGKMTDEETATRSPLAIRKQLDELRRDESRLEAELGEAEATASSPGRPVPQE